MKAEKQIKALENENALLKGKLQLVESMFRTSPNFRTYKAKTEVMATTYREFNKRQDQKEKAEKVINIAKDSPIVKTNDAILGMQENSTNLEDLK